MSNPTAVKWRQIATDLTSSLRAIVSDEETCPRERIQALLEEHDAAFPPALERLNPPAHLRGRIGRFADPELKAERAAWALAAGQAGYPATAVADALGISPFCARLILKKAGWQWHEQRGRRVIDRQKTAWGRTN